LDYHNNRAGCHRLWTMVARFSGGKANFAGGAKRRWKPNSFPQIQSVSLPINGGHRFLIMLTTTVWNPTEGAAGQATTDDPPAFLESRWQNDNGALESHGPGSPLPVEKGAREPAAIIPDEPNQNDQDAGWKTPKPAADETSPANRDYDSCLTLYLREIGRVKLLSPQEEIELAGRIQAGDQTARDEMIKANLRLVVKIARRYEGLGVPLMDLISEGNIGLIRAIERFQPSKGGKLSTYGSQWIRQAIIRALTFQSRVTRLPMHMMDKLSKMRRVSTRLEAEFGREPNDEELAAELGTTASRVARWRMAVIRPVPLDAQTAGPDSRSYAETIPDERAESPDKKFEEKTTRALVRELVATLTRQETAVLHSRFGLNGHEPKNLEQTGQELNLTDERVRQIQNVALVKLRRRINQLEQRPTESKASSPFSSLRCKLGMAGRTSAGLARGSQRILVGTGS
jgi:RNA polymerase primary sigma factor